MSGLIKIKLFFIYIFLFGVCNIVEKTVLKSK